MKARAESRRLTPNSESNTKRIIWKACAKPKLGRKLSVVLACVLFVIGVIVQACVRGGNYDYILGGRFVTGLGVGSLSMIVPLYNAEVAPAEIRGALVALQQLAITFGIMISYWITYGKPMSPVRP